MSTVHTVDQFKSFPWNSDENWLSYKDNLSFPIGREDDVSLLNKFKRKWYEKNIAKIQKEFIHIQSESEFNKLIQDDELTVIDWSASWCPPCKMIAPHIDKLAKETSNVTFAKIDIDEFQQLARQNQITSVPRFFFYKKGQLLHKIEGADLSGIKNTVANLA